MHGNMNVKYVAVILPKCTVVLNDCSINLYLMARPDYATFKISKPPQIHWTTSTKLYPYVKILTPCTWHCDKV